MHYLISIDIKLNRIHVLLYMLDLTQRGSVSLPGLDVSWLDLLGYAHGTFVAIG